MDMTKGAAGSDDPILTTRAVARLLGVSVSTAQHWIESGAINSWKTPGGHRRVLRSALEEILQGKEERPDALSAAASTTEAFSGPEYKCQSDPTYPMAENEDARLRALACSRLIDSPEEHVFDRLTWLASQIAATPIALVSLLTSTRQWFKSRVGVDVAETPREWAFCSHAIMNNSPFIVTDAHADARFKDNPLVTGQPYIRFYAGFPLFDKDDFRLGTLCVIDQTPRELSEVQTRALLELASIASEEIQRRTSVR